MDHKDFYNKNGYVLIKDFFSLNEANQIIQYANNELNDYEEKVGKYMIYFEDNKNKTRIENFLKYHDKLNNLEKNIINPLINQICDTKMFLFKDKMNWKNPNGDGFTPHQINQHGTILNQKNMLL